MLALALDVNDAGAGQLAMPLVMVTKGSLKWLLRSLSALAVVVRIAATSAQRVRGKARTHWRLLRAALIKVAAQMDSLLNIIYIV